MPGGRPDGVRGEARGAPTAACRWLPPRFDGILLLAMEAYFEGAAADTFDPATVVRDCIESGSDSLLLDEHALPAAFFDLSCGLAGELLHRLSVYHMRLAAVVPDLEAHSPAFQAFAREANRGSQFRFLGSRADAVAWLESA